MSKHVYQIIIHDEQKDVDKSPLYSSKNKIYLYLHNFINRQDVILEQVEINNGSGYLIDVNTDVTCYGYNINTFDVY